MSNHQNRSKKKPSADRNPTPAEIHAARERANLTQTEASALIHGSLRGWQDYEGGQRRMHPGLWELFKLKIRTR